MAEEIDVENGRISNIQRQRDLDLDIDLGSGHMAYRHASLINLYLYQISFKSEKLFVDGRTDIEAGKMELL